MRKWLLGLAVLASVFAAPLAAQDGTEKIETAPVVSAGDENTKEPSLVISGQLRERLTHIDNFEFDPDSPDNSWFLIQRFSITADADLKPNVRGRLSLVSGLLEGEAFEPIQRNDLDIQEAYLEFGPEEAFIRVGRQELLLGSQRLVATRDGTNLRRTWDGVRGVAQIGAFEVQGLALSEVVVQPSGAFNDPVAQGDTLAGIYLTGPAPLGSFDAYFLYAGFDARRTIEGTAQQDRYAIGARFFGEEGRLFWNWEAFYQFGSHGDLDISAWSLATNTGVRFEELAWKPELMLSANIASGDEDNGDGTLGTFDPLFPRGNYFSQAAILGPSNFYNINPSVRVHPDPDLALFADINLYWRLEAEDGIYGPPFILLREPGGSTANFVSTSISVGASYAVTSDIELAVVASQLWVGHFVEESGPSADLRFVEFTVQHRF